ncbi:MAG TPA: cache domain-containing protein [Candidatus Binatia bacterium]|nr:cache domain-containing protein [Candidatus Binatia bacterium]
MARAQGTLRAFLLIAAVIVPAVGVGAFLYSSYVDSQRAYLTRLDYRELGIAADQLRNRVNGLALSWSLLWQERDASTGQIITDRKTRPCSEPVPLADDPSIVCAPESEPKPDRSIRFHEADGIAYLYFPNTAVGRWGRIPVTSVLDALGINRRRFDDVLLISADGYVLHGRAVLGSTVEGAIVAPAKAVGGGDSSGGESKSGGAGSRRLSPSHVERVMAHDAPALLFVQPAGIRVHFQRPGAATSEETDILLGGLIAEHRFSSETRRIPYRWLLIGIVLLIVGLLSWPLLRLRLIGRRERLSTTDVRLVVVAVVGLSALWPAVLLLAGAAADFRMEYEAQLPEIASGVLGTFHNQIEDALDVIEQINDGTDIQEVHSKTGLVRVSIVAADGLIEHTWEIRQSEPSVEIPTVGVNVSDRAYFQAIHSKRPPHRMKDERRFAAEVVRSKRQGTFRTMIAQEAKDGKRVIIAQLGVGKFSEVLLPPGIGFAIVDADGRVQLHSHGTHNLVEDFYSGVDDASELKAAILTRNRADVATAYEGDDVVIRVEPIPEGPPWWLLVFTSTEAVRAFVLETASRWSVLFLAYAFAAIGALLAWEAAVGRERFAWLWPDRSVSAVLYALTAVRVALLAVLGWAASGSASASERMLVVVAVPVLALACALRDLTWQRKVGTRGERMLAGSLGALAALAFVYVNVLYGALAALVAGVPPAWILAPPRRRPAMTERRFRMAYVAALLALTGATASMPAIVLFHDARAEVREEFSRSLEKRFFAGRADQEGVYRTFLVRGDEMPTEPVLPIESEDVGPRPAAPPARLSGWITRLLPDASDTIESMRAYAGTVPPLGRNGNTRMVFLGALVMVGLGWLTLAALAIRTFHLEADPLLGKTKTAPVTTKAGRDVILRYVGALANGDGSAPAPAAFDLRRGRDSAALQAWWAQNKASRRFELTHLEARLYDPKWQDAILGILEETVFDPESAITLSSAVEPFDYVRGQAAESAAATAEATEVRTAQLLPRWSLVLSMLAQEPTAALAGDDGRPERPHRETWRLLSREDRLVLRHVAEEGFVAPAALASVRSLLARGLLSRAPMLTIPSESLRRFVLGAESPETIAEWEQAGERSSMEIIARLLPIALVAGLVFVFATQRDVFNATTTIVGAAGSAIPLLLKLLGSFGKDQPAGASR